MIAATRRMSFAVLAVVAAGLVACGAPAVDQARCAPVNEAVLESIKPAMQREGKFRHAFMVQSADAGGIWLVSVELVRKGQDPEVGGDIYTFATTTDPNSGAAADFVSVDPNARDYSTWPTEEALNLKLDGALESRACVNRDRPSRGNTGILGGN